MRKAFFACLITAALILVDSGMCFCSEAGQGSPVLTPEQENSARSVPPQRTDVTIDAMRAELDRSMEKLSLKNYERPYYISYVIKETREIEATAKYGAIFSFDDTTSRPGYVEVRVGSPETDNSKGLEFDYDFNPPPSDQLLDFDFPLNDDAAAIRNRLWMLTDLLYKRALADYMEKRGELVLKAEKQDKVNDFSVEKKQIFVGPARELVFDKAAWLDVLKKASAMFLNYPELVDSAVELSATHERKYLVNSEGSSIVEEHTYYWLEAWAQAWSDDGMLLKHSIDYACRNPEELPNKMELADAITKMISELKELRKADEIKPCAVPAIFDPEMSSAFIHEAIGHRLEGDRLEEEEEGHTFKDKVGQKVLPEFLSLLDNPELSEFNGKSLSGHYYFDEEGVPGQEVLLVENGILKNYLMSRRPTKGFPRSNGHGRLSIDSSGYCSWLGTSPMSRMATLIVRSSNELSPEELEKRLIEECKRSGAEFGLLFKGTLGGHTSTESWDYQAFSASPKLVYRVDAKTGARTLVRGVSIVGTPLNALDKIIATGDDYGVFNAYCGAESGVIPHSGIAPSILLSEIEVQKVAAEKERPPLLPPPAFDK